MADHSEPSEEPLNGHETDRELVRLVQLGSSDAMEKLYQDFYRYVMASLRKSVDDTTAEDLLSEVFIRVVKFCDGFDTQNPGSSVKKWLSRIISNVVADHYKKRYSERERVSRYMEQKAQARIDQSVDRAMVHCDQKMMIEEAINRISEHDHLRQIAIDHLCYGAKPKKLAKMYALPEHQIRQSIDVSFSIIRQYINKRYRDSL